jgi:hypothetical protein
MRNQWVGDIGDFAKYGLLRALTKAPENHTPDVDLVLGVLWFLNENIVTIDGHEELKECCPALYSKLRRIVAIDNRTVSVIKDKSVLPFNTKFFDTPLPSPSRQNRRNEWFALARNELRGANIVYLDPDTGIKIQADRKSPFNPDTPAAGLTLDETTNSREHVSLLELRCLQNDGKSLIFYQHLGQGNRKGEREEHRVQAISDLLAEGLNYRDPIWIFRWGVEITRAYFIVPQKEHRDEIALRLQAFRKTPWVTRDHFTPMQV